MVEGDVENTGAMPDDSQAGLDLRKGACHLMFHTNKTDRNPETVTKDQIQQQEEEE